MGQRFDLIKRATVYSLSIVIVSAPIAPALAEPTDVVEAAVDSQSVPLDVVRQLSLETFPSVGAVLEPVGPEVTPPILSTDAVVAAETEMGSLVTDGFPRTATLARFTDTDQVILDDPDSDADGPLVFDSVLAWVITFSDLCVPVLGPGTAAEASCAGSELNVVIDATSGLYIVAYSMG